MIVGDSLANAEHILFGYNSEAFKRGGVLNQLESYVSRRQQAQEGITYESLSMGKLTGSVLGNGNRVRALRDCRREHHAAFLQ